MTTKPIPQRYARTMRLLAEGKPFASFAELASREGSPYGTVTNVVSDLRKLKLATMQPRSPETLTLTPKGREALAKFDAANVPPAAGTRSPAPTKKTAPRAAARTARAAGAPAPGSRAAADVEQLAVLVSRAELVELRHAVDVVARFGLRLVSVPSVGQVLTDVVGRLSAAPAAPPPAPPAPPIVRAATPRAPRARRAATMLPPASDDEEEEEPAPPPKKPIAPRPPTVKTDPAGDYAVVGRNGDTVARYPELGLASKALQQGQRVKKLSIGKWMTMTMGGGRVEDDEPPAQLAVGDEVVDAEGLEELGGG